MKNIFNEVSNLVELDSLDPKDHLCKLAEEHGELAKEINRVIGRKKRGKYTDAEILHNIKSELCDNIQILFGIARCFNINYEKLYITKNIFNKSSIYNGNLKHILCELSIEYGELATVIIEVTDTGIIGNKILDNIMVLFSITRCVNITYEDLCDEFILKNISYRENIENREIILKTLDN
jgi:NTP pyrophosphatase (non-canonical NTP hydrolase)